MEDEIRVTVIATGFEETAGSVGSRPFSAAGQKVAKSGADAAIESAKEASAAKQEAVSEEPQEKDPFDEIFAIFNNRR